MPWIETGLYVTGAIAVAGSAAYIGSKIYKSKNTVKKAEGEFAANADAFSGLYEPLYLMSKGKIKYRTGILGDWATRTLNLSKAPHYSELWNKKLEGCTEWKQEQGIPKLNELMSFIQNSGICRDQTEQLIVDNNTYKKYNTIDDLIEAGQSACVKSHYWFLGDKIIEKGTIEKSVKE